MSVFDDYLATQEKNLARVSQLRAFTVLVKPLDLIYERSLRLSDGQSGPCEALLMICYKAFLSAAALIGRAQPEDADAITRRAIEAACLGRAIKHDRENLVRWFAYQERTTRTEARLRAVSILGRRSAAARKVRLPREPSICDPPDHDVVKYLRMMQGLLSEHSIHFTPSFVSNQVSSINEDEAADGGTFEMSWFEHSDKKIEIALIALAVAHTKILDLFDECLDGALGRDKEWAFARLAIPVIARRLGSDLGFDRIAEDFERRVGGEGLGAFGAGEEDP
jgi:hypothetical protein